jgi:hypothetical protein
MTTTLIVKSKLDGQSKIFVSEHKFFTTKETKSFAGKMFNEFNTITSASVIDHTGKEVLLLEKDENGKCTRRVNIPS